MSGLLLKKKFTFFSQTPSEQHKRRLQVVSQSIEFIFCVLSSLFAYLIQVYIFCKLYDILGQICSLMEHSSCVENTSNMAEMVGQVPGNPVGPNHNIAMPPSSEQLVSPQPMASQMLQQVTRF